MVLGLFFFFQFGSILPKTHIFAIGPEKKTYSNPGNLDKYKISKTNCETNKVFTISEWLRAAVSASRYQG